MDDLHSINDAINKRAGRKLIPSIIVGFGILGLVFGALRLSPLLFAVLVWIAILLAIREIVRAYKAGGIDIPAFPLYRCKWNSWCYMVWKDRGTFCSLAITIPNVMVFLLLLSPKDLLSVPLRQYLPSFIFHF